MNAVRFILRPLMGAFLGLVGALSAQAVETPANPHAGFEQRFGLSFVDRGADRTESWRDEVVAAFAELPVQHGGRLKPFLTVVRTALYQISHRRTVKTKEGESGEGETLSPVEWALDLCFLPERASHYPVFLITVDSVLQEIGLPDLAKKKRDRYSYLQLQPALAALEELYREFVQTDELDRDPVQRQIVDLYQSVALHDWLRQAFLPARLEFEVHRSGPLRAAFPESPTMRVSELLANGPELLGLFRAAKNKDEEVAVARLIGVARESVVRSEQMALSGRTFAWFPPAADSVGDAPWYSVGDLLQQQLFQSPPETGEIASGQLERVFAIEAGFEGFVDAVGAGDPDAQVQAAERLLGAARSAADKVARLWTVESEADYYGWNMLWWAWFVFLLGFLVLSISWLVPRARRVVLVGGGATILGTVLLTGGLVHRCVLMGRAPVANLYETFLFISCAAVALGLVMEAISKRGITLSLSSLVGVAGLWAASLFELENAGDTMAPLQAVLISNFWLGTHVVCITLGYAVALFSGALAHIWLFGRLLGIARHNVIEYSRLSKKIYGTLCFSLFFTVVGTILGGIWAAESWGRFWGWDPKENGAFLIAVAQLFVLHGRLGGYFKDYGLAMLAVAINGVVAFSWFYVNVMGEGLHSYGFNSAIRDAVLWFWGIEGTVFAVGIVVALLGRHVVRPGPDPDPSKIVGAGVTIASA